MSEVFLDDIDRLRDKMGIPLIINSGFRCDNHNADIGGSPTSKHRLGLASDISTKNLSSEQRYNLIKNAYEIGINGIGIYKNFVHLDHRRGAPSLWVI